MTRRPGEIVLGGSWEFPGGKIETGETPQQAVMREILEEVGIHVQPVASLTTVEHTYDHAHVHLHPWLCRHVSAEPKNLQVSDHQWVTIDKLAAITFPPANGPILDALTNYDFLTF